MAFTSSANANGADHASAGRSVSPRQAVSPKNVAFQLLFPEPQYRARLPMRVQIYPHDTTDSIVTTVKNFYGLYSSPTSSKGVSFEDQHSNTLIARYENFSNNMVVYVRVTEQSFPASCAPEDAPYGAAAAAAVPPSTSEPHYSQDNYPLQAPPRFAAEMTRPTSLSSRWRSPSPVVARGRRSTSVNTNPNASKKGRSRSSRHRDNNSQAELLYSDSINGYSSGDNASSSTSGRKEQIGNTEISLENIVEGGRRKRAKFESSELPLFAPPQMPAATSNPSVSPARRTEHRPALPFAHPGQNPFTNPHPLQSPQSHSERYGQNPYYATPAPDNRRSRDSIGYASQSGGNNMSGILPTPDPTVGSCMSEEDKDVAIQLMRLGDMSNISHGRTSASTLDDTFSGRADAASSTGATSDGDSESEDDQKLDASGTTRKIFHPTQSHFVPRESAEASGEDVDSEDQLASKPKPKTTLTEFPKPNKAVKSQKAPRPPTIKTKKTPVPVPVPTGSGPMSPSSLPPSRKQSVASQSVASVASLPPWGDPEQVDLSAKPRCQRCRKSKKGCDRQRPCGRCRDAGMSADQCISEDEGNGRKGRYGRHMGVPISKEDVATPVQPPLLPAAPISMAAPPIDKNNKKRKR
ncbi:hypothetical protein F5X68DRAFT_14062 [Plectosphaerella plurivora]|uniref:Zn(2)-C6 fungal-type domain-containing protein n=1 Tax=Plectosphaerella plurivora TaxID=936078 RepID=A0A9P8VBQ2_9PEZI|nr:hypothetical protein F5X68DRAFT_14062 [Plectosphaerella plurivora]